MSRRLARVPIPPRWRPAVLGLGLFVLLAVQFAVMFFSAAGDSATYDEVAHLPAGYAYLEVGEYRLNPEHPPLIKDLAALPLLFMDLNFPAEAYHSPSTAVNNQWEFGQRFLFGSGNDADRLLRFGRLPIMLLSLATGLLVFSWARELFGRAAGIVALLLYAFDPNLLAHSRYVTMDLGITFALFLHLYCLWRYLQKPGRARGALAAVTLAVALVTKFSAGLLAPVYLVVAGLLLLGERGSPWPRSGRRLGGLAVIGGLGLLLAWLFYLLHTLQLSPETQRALISQMLPEGTLANVLAGFSDHVLLRPIAQYVLGFVWIAQSVEAGRVAFLFGETSTAGWWYYYPAAILLKTALPLLLLVPLTLAVWKRLPRQDRFTEIYLWLLPAALLLAGTQASLNLGIRYMLPLYPFVFVFVSRLAGLWGTGGARLDLGPRVARLALPVLLVWYATTSLTAYPNYLSYFNELAGDRGYRYLADSNVDWGQDLKRLDAWLEQTGLEEIRLDYFGRALPEYYLGEKYRKWTVQDGRPQGWFAVSVTRYQLSRLSEPSYSWLDGLRPVEVVGGSIFVYYLADSSHRTALVIGTRDEAMLRRCPIG